MPNVHFRDVEVIELPIVPGADHPSNSSSFLADTAAITVDWQPQSRTTVDLDTYERSKKKNKKGFSKMFLPRAVRKRILRKQGFESSDTEDEVDPKTRDGRRFAKKKKKKKKPKDSSKKKKSLRRPRIPGENLLRQTFSDRFSSSSTAHHQEEGEHNDSSKRRQPQHRAAEGALKPPSRSHSPLPPSSPSRRFDGSSMISISEGPPALPWHSRSDDEDPAGMSPGSSNVSSNSRSWRSRTRTSLEHPSSPGGIINSPRRSDGQDDADAAAGGAAMSSPNSSTTNPKNKSWRRSTKKALGTLAKQPVRLAKSTPGRALGTLAKQPVRLAKSTRKRFTSSHWTSSSDDDAAIVDDDDEERVVNPATMMIGKQQDQRHRHHQPLHSNDKEEDNCDSSTSTVDGKLPAAESSERGVMMVLPPPPLLVSDDEHMEAVDKPQSASLLLRDEGHIQDEHCYGTLPEEEYVARTNFNDGTFASHRASCESLPSTTEEEKRNRYKGLGGASPNEDSTMALSPHRRIRRRSSLTDVLGALAKKPVRVAKSTPKALGNLAKQPVRLAKSTHKRLKERQSRKKKNKNGTSESEDGMFTSDEDIFVSSAAPLPTSPELAAVLSDDNEGVLLKQAQRGIGGFVSSDDDERWFSDLAPTTPPVARRGLSPLHPGSFFLGGSERSASQQPQTPMQGRRRSSLTHALGTLAKQPVRLAKSTRKRLSRRISKRGGNNTSSDSDNAMFTSDDDDAAFESSTRTVDLCYNDTTEPVKSTTGDTAVYHQSMPEFATSMLPSTMADIHSPLAEEDLPEEKTANSPQQTNTNDLEYDSSVTPTEVAARYKASDKSAFDTSLLDLAESYSEGEEHLIPIQSESSTPDVLNAWDMRISNSLDDVHAALDNGSFGRRKSSSCIEQRAADPEGYSENILRPASVHLPLPITRNGSPEAALSDGMDSNDEDSWEAVDKEDISISSSRFSQCRVDETASMTSLPPLPRRHDSLDEDDDAPLTDESDDEDEDLIGSSKMVDVCPRDVSTHHEVSVHEISTEKLNILNAGPIEKYGENASAGSSLSAGCPPTLPISNVSIDALMYKDATPRTQENDDDEEDEDDAAPFRDAEHSLVDSIGNSSRMVGKKLGTVERGKDGPCIQSSLQRAKSSTFDPPVLPSRVWGIGEAPSNADRDNLKETPDFRREGPKRAKSVVGPPVLPTRDSDSSCLRRDGPKRAKSATGPPPGVLPSRDWSIGESHAIEDQKDSGRKSDFTREGPKRAKSVIGPPVLPSRGSADSTYVRCAVPTRAKSVFGQPARPIKSCLKREGPKRAKSATGPPPDVVPSRDWSIGEPRAEVGRENSRRAPDFSREGPKRTKSTTGPPVLPSRGRDNSLSSSRRGGIQRAKSTAGPPALPSRSSDDSMRSSPMKQHGHPDDFEPARSIGRTRSLHPPSLPQRHRAMDNGSRRFDNDDTPANRSISRSRSLHPPSLPKRPCNLDDGSCRFDNDDAPTKTVASTASTTSLPPVPSRGESIEDFDDVPGASIDNNDDDDCSSCSSGVSHTSAVVSDQNSHATQRSWLSDGQVVRLNSVSENKNNNDSTPRSPCRATSWNGAAGSKRSIFVEVPTALTKDGRHFDGRPIMSKRVSWTGTVHTQSSSSLLLS